MNDKYKYVKEEGSYRREGVGGKSVWAIGLGVCLCLVVAMFFFSQRNDDAKTEGARKAPELHNSDLKRMSVADLEYVATNSRKKSDREEALFLLFDIYQGRSLFNLYDFYLKYKGEPYTDQALAIVIYKSDSIYEEALRENSEQAWSDVLVTVPEDFQHDARDRYLEFRWAHTAELWDTEEKAWEQVQRQQGGGAYERYIKLYPDGPHVAEAKRTIRRYHEEAVRRERSYEESKRLYKKWIEKINRNR